MYKNIVFDFGGVMVDFDPHKYLIDLFGNRGLEEEVYDLTFGSREWRLLDAGRITRREANERMLQRARAVGRGFEVEGVLDDWMSMLRPRRRMQTLVEQLKQWIDAEYEGGRQTTLATHELEAKIEQLSGGKYKRV